MNEQQLNYVADMIMNRVLELSKMADRAPLSQHAAGELMGLNFAANCLREALDNIHVR